MHLTGTSPGIWNLDFGLWTCPDAQSPNSPFPFFIWLCLGLARLGWAWLDSGLGLRNWDLDSGLSITYKWQNWQSKSLWHYLLFIKTHYFWPQRIDVDYPRGVERLRLVTLTCSHHTWSDHIPGVIQGPESHSVIPTSTRQSRDGVVHSTEISLVISASDWSELSSVTLSLVVRCPLTFILSWQSVLLITCFESNNVKLLSEKF